MPGAMLGASGSFLPPRARMLCIRMLDRVRRFRPLAFVLALVFLAGCMIAHARELQPLEIASKNGVHTFAIELALTDEEQARGLMFRRELPEGQGMLFDFGDEGVREFWMKNTYIPLDMIFIRGDGRIAKIAEHTVPLSEARVSSDRPVRAVLEVIAGTSRKLGIAAGDSVSHAIFSRR
jgi:uncharacterized membrane protein (UPF0127 family)